MAFMGICFEGARAISQAFFSFRVSVSMGRRVGVVVVVVVEGC